MPGKSEKLKVTVVGAGNVGTVLSLMLKRRGHSVVSIISRSRKSARALAARVSCAIAADTVASISPRTNFLLITTPDDSVEQVAGAISGLDLQFAKMPVVHTSGVLTSDVLAPLAARGAYSFSFHPIQSFPSATRSSFPLSSMKGVWYGFEGPVEARPIARKLTRIFGGRFLEVPKEKKILYHLACVFASNYPVVLVGAVERIAQQVSRGDISPFQKLFLSSSDNAFQMRAGKALTGPLSRGSMSVLHRHMAALSTQEPELLAMYSAIGLFALEILREKGSLGEDEIGRLESLLSGNDDR